MHNEKHKPMTGLGNKNETVVMSSYIGCSILTVNSRTHHKHICMHHIHPQWCTHMHTHTQRVKVQGQHETHTPAGIQFSPIAHAIDGDKGVIVGKACRTVIIFSGKEG